MKVLIAGSAGQLGRALQASAPAGVTVTAPAEADFDICDPEAIARVVAAAAPALVINAAAYTAVDKAETEAAIAQRVNVNATTPLGFRKTHAEGTNTHQHTTMTPSHHPLDATVVQPAAASPLLLSFKKRNTM